MKTLIIAREDYLGAGKGALRLYQSFKRKKEEVCLLVKNKKVNVNDQNIVSYDDIIRSSMVLRVKHFIKNRILQKVFKNEIVTNPDYYFFGLHDLELDIDVKRILKKLPFVPETIILTWSSGFFSPQSLFKLQHYTKAKLIGYPMDMSLLTGGCHYSWGCEGYTQGCQYCPAILDEKNKNKAAQNLAAKKKFYQNSAMEIVVPSTELFNQASRSALFKDQLRIKKSLIPVDEKIFNSRNRKKARAYFKLSDDLKIIFFGASFTNEKRKGLDILRKSFDLLKNIYDENHQDVGHILILIAGNKPSSFDTDKLFPFKTIYVGYITDEETFSLAYQSANVFLSTSIQDSGPMMINESVMCGTPVIAFNIGVSEDMILENQTGHKIPCGEVGKLSKALYSVLENTEHYSAIAIERYGFENTSFFNFKPEIFS